MFGRCEAPFWREDDFTACFRRDYLTILLPLLSCTLSLLVLLVTTYLSFHRLVRLDGYSYLRTNTSDSITVSEVDILRLAGVRQPHGNAAGAEDPPEEQDGISVEISRPRAALLTLTLETLCLLGGVVASAITVVTILPGAPPKDSEVAILFAWNYLFVLCILRLYFQLPKTKPFPQLWDHSALLYGVFWVVSVINFRSSLMHPVGPQSLQDAHVLRFVLITILVVMVSSVRRGNRPVVLLRERSTIPSREPLASIASKATFSWFDGFVWKGWKSVLEIDDVWNVLPKERAAVVLTSFRQYRKTTRLALHLIKYFKWDLLYQQLWALVSGISTFVPTLLLKAILEYVEDPLSTPVATAWLWVALLLVVSCFTGIADGQALWRGRKICISLRSILIGEIYAKTLRRKAASSGEKDMNAAAKGSTKTLRGRLQALWNRVSGKDNSENLHAETENQQSNNNSSADAQVSSGTILNLMSVDSFRVSEISAYFHFLFPTVPVELIIAITLLFSILGWSAIAGVVVMIAVLPLNIFFSNQFSKTHKRVMAATDRRIHATNEVLQNVRIIKFFAWENRFASNIDEKRHAELAAIRYRFGLWATASVIWFGVPLLITMLSFFLYTVVEKKPLHPSVAFTALSLFSLLRYPLDRLADMLAHILESKVSIDRVETFLNEDETGKYDQLVSRADNEVAKYIGFKGATFSWGPLHEPLNRTSHAFRLINLDVEFHIGGLNIIAGPTGSGKTSLLLALLGEMTLISGSVHLPGGYNRLWLRAGSDGLTESVAYCAQQAWLVNDTIKQNILFASAFDERRYKQVIHACALERDLEVFESGDATLVGEKGVVVSGGQKQRISLARALYSNARYILLDDCLSAVDSHTAQHIFDHCVLGPLMKNRTCILVTHNIALCVPRADHVVVLRNGKLAGQGSAPEILASGLLGTESTKPSENSALYTTPNSRSQSVGEGGLPTADSDTNGHPAQDANGHSSANAKPNSKIVQVYKEKKAEGSVDFRVLLLYLRSMGHWYLWLAMLIAYALENLANASTNIWIRQWANSYGTQSVGVATPTNSSYFTLNPESWMYILRPTLPYNTGNSFSKVDITLDGVSGDDGIGYYLGIYAALSLAYIVVALARLGILFKGSLNASRALHGRLLNAVLRAKFKFFDTTPLGQIMNRFSKDLQAIDQDIAPTTAGVLQCLFSIIVIVVMISAITPGFLVAALFLTLLYFAIGAFYLETSRDLKRLESTHRSPLYQQFGETISGVITIRAYGDERRFIDDNAKRINAYNRPFIFLWGANRWLALRVDFAGALVAFVAAAFIIAQIDTIDAGAAGLSLTYALGFNESILWLVRLYSENEQNMNHVERVKEFLEVEQEAPAHIPEKRPLGIWPSKGAIRFEKYTTRYRADLEPVLINLNIDIKGEEKVGIVGRTGAGKSSLALALFRGLEADSGQIFIDDVDIGTIGLQDLRENLTVVPQDPTLFTGTIRSNLDPFELHKDEEIFTALRQVHLIDPSAETEVPPRSTIVLGGIDEESTHVEEPDVGTAAGDLSAPSHIRRSSVSASSVVGEDGQLGLARVATNSRENANIFLDLASPVAESGSNLSQGQRQLLCLARALLKAPRVLLMDEATASIDYETDAKIQDTLRELRDCTLVTIAHRLQTIVDYDKLLVLEKGEVAEFGPPWELIHKEGGMFRGMCEQSGDFEVLLAAAEGAKRKHQLVDIDA